MENCFLLIWKYILQNQTKKSENVYQNWIDTYGGEDFALAVNQAVEITDRFAAQASPETRLEMDKAFEKASKLEWMF